jgi:hypothetical protein
MPDERTYGFSLRDATDLVNGIGSGESSYPEIKPRGSGGGSGGGGIRYVRFALTGAWASNEADATFTEMNGDAIESSTLKDPLAVASSLEIGDLGYAISQDNNYYFVQAPCPVVGE